MAAKEFIRFPIFKRLDNSFQKWQMTWSLKAWKQQGIPRSAVFEKYGWYLNIKVEPCTKRMLERQMSAIYCIFM